uniref:PH01B001I13.9 protein n=1 Tax=Phyllostachys edulis TaxID=38705 RepID=L0P3P6_PHYED|nr:PH01B001I13.9 [Phyllostachys edulis]
MTWSQEIQDDQTVDITTCNYCQAKLTARTAVRIGHLNRHYKACLRKIGVQSRGGGVQMQLNFEADGSVSTWVYNPLSAQETFSMVGRIIKERRSSLTPRMVEAITCVKDWELAKERQQHQLEDLEIVQTYADLERVNDLDIDE